MTKFWFLSKKCIRNSQVSRVMEVSLYMQRIGNGAAEDYNQSIGILSCLGVLDAHAVDSRFSRDGLIACTTVKKRQDTALATDDKECKPECGSMHSDQEDSPSRQIADVIATSSNRIKGYRSVTM